MDKTVGFTLTVQKLLEERKVVSKSEKIGVLKPYY